jgi:hypothetical protein
MSQLLFLSEIFSAVHHIRHCLENAVLYNLSLSFMGIEALRSLGPTDSVCRSIGSARDLRFNQ